MSLKKEEEVLDKTVDFIMLTKVFNTIEDLYLLKKYPNEYVFPKASPIDIMLNRILKKFENKEPKEESRWGNRE